MTMEKTVLIVDDSENIRNILIFTLDRAGYKVLSAIDGLDALKFLNGRTLDLIITDLYMPNINGLEFTRKVRKNPVYTKVPILFLTTESQQDKKLCAKDMGANAWLIKPFSPEKLLEAIIKLMSIKIETHEIS